MRTIATLCSAGGISTRRKTEQCCTPRYAFLPEVPRTECLKDVVERFLPYYIDVIAPQAMAGKNVMIAAHGNSLRALVKYLDNISDEEIAGLNIPTGMPLVYRLGDDFSDIRREQRHVGFGQEIGMGQHRAAGEQAEIVQSLRIGRAAAGEDMGMGPVAFGTMGLHMALILLGDLAQPG